MTEKKTVAKKEAPLNTAAEELAKRLALRKQRQEQDKKAEPPQPKPITEGPVDKITEVLVNPAAEKMLEVTDLDRNQVTLIPQIVVMDDIWDYIEQVASFRSDSKYYEKIYEKQFPETPDTTGKFILTLARCRRSLGGKTQKALEDLALADLESRNNNMEDMLGGHGFGEV